ncbi:MAG: polyphosphate kinase 2 [Phyllobacterium sp.]
MAKDGNKSSKKKHKDDAGKNKKSKKSGVVVHIGGKERLFDVYDPKLPKWIDDLALSSGRYPYSARMHEDEYDKTLLALQIELVKLQNWLHETGHRILAIFEGSDAAGKGGTIAVLREYMNPRSARNVALPKPTETEQGQWYFQRYVTHFPTSGEFVTFDRSWYNRAGVEPVMGFCTPEQHAAFLSAVPDFEKMIVNEGIHFFKFWLDIGQAMQLKRFHERVHSPLKKWKFSPMDVAGMQKWDEYGKARDLMLERTHSEPAPWTIIEANDKRRSRIAAIRRILLTLPYKDRDLSAIGKEDDLIIGSGPEALKA